MSRQPSVTTTPAAPDMLCFPQAAYNMAATVCRLSDISDTPEPRTNEKLLEARWVLHFTLEQQAKSSASRHLKAVPADADLQRGLLRCSHPTDGWQQRATAPTIRG